jgi:hypothetical protein
MATTYLFRKQAREEVYDYDTSYCFKLPRGKGWLHLNKKATKLVEKDDCFEVTLAHWYIDLRDKHIGAIMLRQDQCKELQENYYKYKELYEKANK